jgi:hypothetical protein
MRELGFSLEIVRNPPTGDKGATITARYAKLNEVFQATASEEKLAVCGAALEAFGVRLADLIVTAAGGQ